MWTVPQLQHQFLLEGYNNNEKTCPDTEDTVMAERNECFSVRENGTKMNDA